MFSEGINVRHTLINEILSCSYLYFFESSQVQKVQIGANFCTKQHLTTTAQLFGQLSGNSNQIVLADFRNSYRKGSFYVRDVILFVVRDELF